MPIQPRKSPILIIDDDSDLDDDSANDLVQASESNRNDNSSMTSSSSLSTITGHFLEYASKIFNKFLGEIRSHPYVNNTPSCKKASKDFCKYFTRHEDLLKDSEISPLLHRLDDANAGAMYITLSKKHKTATTKGKHRMDDEEVHEPTLHLQHQSATKEASDAHTIKKTRAKYTHSDRTREPSNYPRWQTGRVP
jgi:hypothetical protein